MYIMYFLFVCLILFLQSIRAYNLDEATIAVFLSGAAYCGKENYSNMTLRPPANELEVKRIIYDVKSDLQGYLGVISSRKNIYVVFRGSSSGLNWVKDLEIKKIPYDTFPDCNCNIHKGFYESTLAVKDEVIKEVKLLLSTRQYERVIVSGHSYGAGCSQIMAMELVKEDIPEVQVYNFGQPRIGDTTYANYVNKKMSNYWRFTHNKDIVPHVPTIKCIDYYHSCGEIFENESGQLHTCSMTECEDKTCADQYDLKETNGDDHKVYLQHPLTCESSTM